MNTIVDFEIGGSIYEGPGNLDYCVDWGDGSIEWFTNVPSGEMIDVVHNWMEIGDYVISCFAVAEGGLESEIATHDIQIIPALPSPPVIIGPHQAVVGTPISFTMGGSDYLEPGVLNYTYTMGDGYTGGFELSPGTVTEIDYTYYGVDMYVVTLTVYDPVTGDGITTMHDIHIIPQPPTPPLIFGPMDINSGQIVEFTVGGSEYAEYVLLDYEISWGDGGIDSFELYPGEMIPLEYSWFVEEETDFMIQLTVFDPYTSEAVISTFFITVTPAQTCLFTLVMYDDYGDGWNGGFIDIYVNGLLMYGGITLETGYLGYLDVFYTNADLIDISYTPGSYAYENAYEIYNPHNALMFSDGMSGTVPTGGSFVADCNAFSPPSAAVINGPSMGFVGDMLLFHLGGSVYYPITELSYVIDWGDGTTQPFAVESGIMIDIPYSWMNPGVYTLSLSVIDPFTGDAVVTFYDVSIQEEPTGCPFTLVLYDSYGDGWDEGFIDIYANGVLMYNGITLETGYLGYLDVIMTNADLIDIVYTPGFWPSENSYEIYNPNDVLMFSDGMGGTAPTGGSFIADCYSINPPTPPLIQAPIYGYVNQPIEFTVGGSEYIHAIHLDYTIDLGDGTIYYFTLLAGETTDIIYEWNSKDVYTITLSVSDPLSGMLIETTHDILITQTSDASWFSVSLYDSFGDGWNNALLTIKINGIAVLESITLESGHGPETFIFNTYTEHAWAEFIYTPGFWAYENSYYVYNCLGELVFEDGIDDTIPTGGLIILLSPSSCLNPSPPTIVGPSEGVSGEPIEFLVGGSFGGFGLLSYFVDFGDGFISQTPFIEPGEMIPILHIWDIPGEYLIMAWAETQDGMISYMVEHPIVISGGYTKQKNTENRSTKTTP